MSSEITNHKQRTPQNRDPLNINVKYWRMPKWFEAVRHETCKQERDYMNTYWSMKPDSLTQSPMNDTSLSWGEWTQQLQAYLTWVNSQLRKHPRAHQVADLRTDMCNGLALAHLVEIISGLYIFKLLLIRWRGGWLTNLLTLWLAICSTDVAYMLGYFNAIMLIGWSYRAGFRVKHFNCKVNPVVVNSYVCLWTLSKVLL